MIHDTFADSAPVICFTFFIGALVFGMLFIHPFYVTASMLCAVCYYLTVKRGKGIRTLLRLVPVFVVLSAVNPLFNTLGETVLFRIFGRPYTWEALCYGMSIAGMFVTVTVWFLCYDAVMTSDKFTCMFGRLIPALSMLLVMVLRLVPEYMRRAKQTVAVRKCIGKGQNRSASRRKRIQDGAAVLSSLTGWALESSVVTADSMRARGYGSGKRSSFMQYRFSLRDRGILAVMLLLGAVTFSTLIKGSASVRFIPALELETLTPGCIGGLISYSLFLLIPTILNLWEEAIWRISRSNI